MTFEIQIELNQRWYRMTVERTYESPSMESFTVSAGDRFLQLQTDRPSAIKRRRKPQWKITGGQIRSSNLQSAAIAVLRVFDAIEKHFKPVEERNVHQRAKD